MGLSSVLPSTALPSTACAPGPAVGDGHGHDHVAVAGRRDTGTWTIEADCGAP